LFASFFPSFSVSVHKYIRKAIQVVRYQKPTDEFVFII
jgi:hypothetical protein